MDNTFKPSIFLLISEENYCDQLENDSDLHGEIFHIHANLKMLWIPVGMTGFDLGNFAKQ